MKKIPTLFKRTYDGPRIKGITDEVTPGLEWVLAGEGLATVKIDGTCCAVIGGKFYKRYDAKKGKTPPPGAIPCCDPDPVTGHWPHWLLVDPADQGSNWHLAAYYNAGGTWLSDGTYEAIGPQVSCSGRTVSLSARSSGPISASSGPTSPCGLSSDLCL